MLSLPSRDQENHGKTVKNKLTSFFWKGRVPTIRLIMCYISFISSVPLNPSHNWHGAHCIETHISCKMLVKAPSPATRHQDDGAHSPLARAAKPKSKVQLSSRRVTLKGRSPSNERREHSGHRRASRSRSKRRREHSRHRKSSRSKRKREHSRHRKSPSRRSRRSRSKGRRDSSHRASPSRRPRRSRSKGRSDSSHLALLGKEKRMRNEAGDDIFG